MRLLTDQESKTALKKGDMAMTCFRPAVAVPVETHSVRSNDAVLSKAHTKHEITTFIKIKTATYFTRS